MIPILIPAPSLGSAVAARSRAWMVSASGPASPVRRARVDPLHPRKPLESSELAAGQDDREAVRDDAIAPADGRVGNSGAERVEEPPLLGVDPRACARGAGVRERRRRQLHDDLCPGRRRRRGVASAGRGAEKRCSCQDGERKEKAPHGY